MQRILSRGEIENLDQTRIPRVLLPDGVAVFTRRASRLRQLATDSPLADYLSLMAHLADGQAAACPLSLDSVPAQRLSTAQAHGMPPLQALGWPREPVWLDVLSGLLNHVAQAPDVPPAAAATCQSLQQRFQQAPHEAEAMADALLARLEDGVDAVAVPFVMAALQVYWTSLASSFNLNNLPVVTPFGVCPLCGSLPVASLVRVGKQIDGCRYLSCSVCATQWHLVRVVCSHCEDTEKISFHSIENGPEGIKAEACDKCGIYRKIFYHEKQAEADAVADDLASLQLDILMGQEGYFRASDNPLLWQKRDHSKPSAIVQPKSP